MANGADTLQIAELREFFEFMTGDKLGHGMSRMVYDHPTDPTKVIKMENAKNEFQNVMEWEFWKKVEYAPKIARWLAPCHSISYNGTFLIQEKARDLGPSERPAHLPVFITDHKLENFGMIGKQIVCRDYGFIIDNISTRLRKWRA